ncbi:NapC/NirT family cytochrome c [Geobacter sp. SVR]|uniref:NapC/NirT family cytochrome c n=1 Tax=Geobacter sp. SVR TaxID=2495594 RepID=UPI00143F0325|nr:NapC/NirT family cytochrome c [Geobacter sp. SVR]BCS56002.1 cytochrome c [Geobacter sp. SVR]GCF84765.1 cytochrome c [Geobacter sp. SVR]
MSKAKRGIFKYYMNPISLIGMLISAVSALVIVLVLALQAFMGVENPYLEMFTYLALPGGIILGGVLTYLGAWRVRKQERMHPDVELPPLPRLDFNDPQKLRLTVFFAFATVVFFAVIGVASIKGFEFTESPTFCGELCHTVMQPEYTAWKNSPHANVKCVECHVGPGAAWYVKAKISGMRQLWAVATHSWPTPIHTPIENLRPSRGTCEHCHWPQKFYAGRQKIFYHYAPNETNTPREIDMLIKIGGTPKTPNAMGIHWHIGREVHFIAGDKQRLTIPYVAVKGADGKITEYMDSSKPLTREEIGKAEKRLMDCTDCHNKPTHIYYSPGEEMDRNFASNTIDRSLPFVKKVAVELLEKPYTSTEEAVKAIDAGIKDYYAKNYPEVASKKADAIAQASERIQAIYKRNYFPKMKVKWNTYPNHIGHFYTPGCFRCHDGKHKSPEGRVISKDCKLCHDVLKQTQENIPAGQKVTDFVHPVDIGDELFKTNCSECHSAGGHDVAGGGKH